MNTRRYAELISDKTYRAIFDAADDAIFLHNCHDGSIVDVNQRMCEMYGYERDEALRLTVGDLSSGTAPYTNCLLYTSPSPRDLSTSRMPSSA